MVKDLLIENIYFSYLIKSSFFKTKKVLALKNISLCVKQGEKIGFIGSNGSGKSTLARVIANLVNVDSGKIINNFETTFLLPNSLFFEKSLSGIDNIKVFMSLVANTNDSDIQERIYNDIVEFSELGDRLSDKVGSYSDGMYTRLAVSVLNFLNPDLLIIDENLGAGDLNFQNKTINFFRKNISKKTLIFISHNHELLKEFCPNSYWIKNGTIHDFGATSEILKKYENQ
tara:strand:+ start:567 stop:1253 length:687 start_codon:yes stop_codon:yes gene_type:complete